MNWFIAAVIAMLCWSGSDLFSKAGSKQSDKYSHYKVGIAVGLIMGIHAVYSITIGGVPFSFSDIITYLPASFFYILSMMLGYVALRYIELSISSPICNTSGAMAALLSMIIFGISWNVEPEGNEVFLNIPIVIGIICTVIGVLALGIIEYSENDEAREMRQSVSGRKYTKSFIAIAFPILYCILDAVGTFVDTLIADKYIGDFVAGNAVRAQELGEDGVDLLCGDILNTAYEFTWFFMAIIFAIYVFVIKRQKIDKKFDATKLIGGTCETVGQVFYMMVVVSGQVQGFAIISSYCAVSVLWSRIFLKEKLSWKHYLAIAIAFVGIFILGYFDV